MKRDTSIDLLRIVCCLMVISIHVTIDYSFTVASNLSTFIQIQSLFVQSLVRIGLPIFFMISGYYLLNRKNDGLFEFYKKRVPSLLIPFFIYSAIHFYVISFVNGEDNSILIYFEKLYTNSTALSIHFWFVYAMLGLYILTPFIKYLTDKIPANDTIKAMLAVFCIFYYSLYSFSASQSFNHYHHLIPIQSLDTWVVYFLFGGFIKRLNIRTKFIIATLPVAFIVHTLTVYLSVNKYNFNLYPYDSGANMLIVASLTLIAFASIKISNDSLFSKIVEKIAPLTYGIYLIHVCVILSLNNIFQIPFIVNYVIFKTISLSIIVFVISGLLAYVVDKFITNPILLLLNR